MNWISAVAIYFIIWWVVLFMILPVGVRSQVEENDVTLGTEHGAPVKPALGKKMALTTVVAGIIFGVFYLATVVMGYGIDDLPRIVPKYQ
ncbi:DUF1467 family protein [Oricola sp.]|uniref:DUF1467 family protein n=1 Tax=Oricola sp. TaxID=1979950 RepID=UPI002600AC4D|nr:DUF1467 family protein [Oricola sp.]MCI5075794.1 DUF1467 family protein [Oricola sp.]